MSVIYAIMSIKPLGISMGSKLSPALANIFATLKLI